VNKLHQVRRLWRWAKRGMTGLIRQDIDPPVVAEALRVYEAKLLAEQAPRPPSAVQYGVWCVAPRSSREQSGWLGEEPDDHEPPILFDTRGEAIAHNDLGPSTAGWAYSVHRYQPCKGAKCWACGHAVIEAWLRMKGPATPCPQCHVPNLGDGELSEPPKGAA